MAQKRQRRQAQGADVTTNKSGVIDLCASAATEKTCVASGALDNSAVEVIDLCSTTHQTSSSSCNDREDVRHGDREPRRRKHRQAHTSGLQEDAIAAYMTSIDSHLKMTEDIYRSREGFLSGQTEVNAKMRAILVDWLIEVHLKFRLVPETLFLAINILDRYLEREVSHALACKLELPPRCSFDVHARAERAAPKASAGGLRCALRGGQVRGGERAGGEGPRTGV